MAADRTVTPGLDALARIAGVDRHAFDDDPRRILPALGTAFREVLEVALGLDSQDPAVRAEAAARRRALLQEL